jgi:hypothetical protein
LRICRIKIPLWDQLYSLLNEGGGVIFWFTVIKIIIYIILIYLAYSMAPDSEEQSPATLDAMKAPTADLGREIPVLFGTMLIEGPNVVWYGDFKSVPLYD